MNEIALTTIIFFSLSSSAWLVWYFLFTEKVVELAPTKQEIIPVNPLELYINDMEQRYEETSIKADAFAQENRELKGKLFHEKNRVLTLTDRLHDLQGRDFVFNSQEDIKELEIELKEKEETIKKLMSQLALHPIEEEDEN